MTTQASALQRENIQARNIMIFVLVMSLAGLADLIAEIMPSLELGPIEVSISTFWFVPLTLCILFFGWWAALAAPIGELVFSDLLLGEFGGLGEIEEVILVAIALYIAGWLVRDPKNRRQLIIAGLASYFIAELAGTFIDVLKVWVGVEEFEAVEGLPESILALEGIDFFFEYIVTGIIFGLLPMLWLVPRLHGKIEPLMGLRPRSARYPQPQMTNNTLITYFVAGLVVATLLAVLGEMDMNEIFTWEPEFLDTIGAWFIYVAIGIAVVIAAVVLYLRSNSSKAA